MANYVKQIDEKNVSQDYGSTSYTFNANICDIFMHIILLNKKEIKAGAQAIIHGRRQKGCPYWNLLMCDNKRCAQNKIDTSLLDNGRVQS